MFRLGGAPSADGVGITSGMRRTGFQKPINATAGTQEIIEGLQEKIMTKPKFGWQDLISEGYRTSRGATDWRDWVNQASDRALEIQDERKGLPAQQLEQLLNIKKHQTDRLKATTDPQIANRQLLLTDVMGQISQWQRDNPGKGVNDFLESGGIIEIDAKMRSANPAWPGITAIKFQIEDQIRDHFGDTLGTVQGPTEEEIDALRQQLIQSWIGSYLGFKGNAMGGKPMRRGYNLGQGPVMDAQLTEQINTPTEDVSMTEDVQMTEPGQASEDPYILLRARLPQEIPDDVVRLIAYNPDAFADFASIETQEDVIAFNQQYGVELVVNTDELA